MDVVYNVVNRMSKFARGILYLCVSVVLYSIMPVLIRTLGHGHVPPASQVFLRYIVAFGAALLYFAATKSRIAIKKHDIPLLICVALFGYALVNLFYTWANLSTQIGTVLFIFNSSTVLGPLLGFLFLKERMNSSKIIAMVIGLLSLFFLFRPGPFVTWEQGALFAFIAAIGSSFYVIGRKKLGTYDSKLILLINTVVGVVVLGFIAIMTESHFFTGSGVGSLTPTTWIVTVLFGLDNFTAYLFMTKGYQLVSAGTGSMVMLSENFLAILFGFLFFSEIPTVTTFIGGALILTASMLVILKSERV